MDFIWRIAMESPDEEIANEAIQLIITYSYINLNPKMKKVRRGPSASAWRRREPPSNRARLSSRAGLRVAAQEVHRRLL